MPAQPYSYAMALTQGGLSSGILVRPPRETPLGMKEEGSNLAREQVFRGLYRIKWDWVWIPIAQYQLIIDLFGGENVYTVSCVIRRPDTYPTSDDITWGDYNATVWKDTTPEKFITGTGYTNVSLMIYLDSRIGNAS